MPSHTKTPSFLRSQPSEASQPTAPTGGDASFSEPAPPHTTLSGLGPRGSIPECDYGSQTEEWQQKCEVLQKRLAEASPPMDSKSRSSMMKPQRDRLRELAPEYETALDALFAHFRTAVPSSSTGESTGGGADSASAGGHRMQQA